MTQLPRFFLTAAVAGVCVFASPVFVVLPPSAAYGEEVEESADTADTADTAESTEPKAAPETVAPDANSALRQEVKDFWHYAKIARYEAATDSLSKVIARESEALAVLGAFEQVSRARRDDLDTWLFRWQGTKELREPVTKLLTMLEAGRLERRLIPAQINENIERLNQGERPFDIASSRLKDSGELAVSIMVDWLKNPERKAHHAGVRRALVRMGRAAVNPLVAATAVKDADTLVQVIAVLGDLGYDAAVPYLLELVQSDRSTAVKQAAKQALGKLGVTDPAAVNAADAFYDLAENLYYGRASLVYDAQFPNAFVWNWDEQTGLLKKEVPAAIFNDVMSMRCSEQSLRLSPDKGEAVSLWLAANYKREVDLPQGATDASRAENTPNAHYYGVASGAQFLEAALNRALRDNNAAVALKAIESLQQIVGQSNLFTDEQRPLIDALR